MCGPHGTCSAPNTCDCDEGWEGLICIDISHETEPIELELLSDWNVTYYVVFLAIVGAILFGLFLLGLKIKNDKYFIGDIKELAYYLLSCCKLTEKGYSVG